MNAAAASPDLPGHRPAPAGNDTCAVSIGACLLLIISTGCSSCTTDTAMCAYCLTGGVSVSMEKVVTRPHQGADTAVAAWDDDGGGSRDRQAAVCWWDVPPMVEKYIKDAEGWVVWPEVASHVRQQLICGTLSQFSVERTKMLWDMPTSPNCCGITPPNNALQCLHAEGQG